MRLATGLLNENTGWVALDTAQLKASNLSLRAHVYLLPSTPLGLSWKAAQECPLQPRVPGTTQHSAFTGVFAAINSRVTVASLSCHMIMQSWLWT